MHVRRKDRVVVLSGDDAGKVGEVLRVLPESGKVVVAGVNVVMKHVRRSPQNPQGGRQKREAPLPASKVMLHCATCDRPARSRRTRGEDGRLARTCARCGKPFGGGA
jgi:large subunit ribosomal protein L24